MAGKYFFADFVPTNDNATSTFRQILEMSSFDRNLATTAYNGANGTIADLTSLWNSLIYDPTDPTYTSSIGAMFGFDHVVSFGEDNAGNLYVVDFGDGTGSAFQSQYPGAGRGEIFKLVPIPEPSTICFMCITGCWLLWKCSTKRGKKQTGLCSVG